jgi:acylphosphatase
MRAAMEQRRIRARVTGQVQGVFYRASTVERADELGLVGWVRNCADGAVEMEAEGTVDRIEQLLAWCRRGPPAARVAGVHADWIEPLGTERAFRVRR